MKKLPLTRLIACCAAVLALALFLPGRALAAQSGDLTYQDCGTYIEITGYTGHGTTLAIPSKIGVKPVTSIGVSAFDGCTSLTGITLPPSIRSIGAGAFACCSRLKSLTIPNGVTIIDEGLCYACTSLTSISIPSSVASISRNAFSFCKSLTGITIPSGVTYIDLESFSYCTSLLGITIPASVTEMNHDVFWGCTNLAKVVFLGDKPMLEYDTLRAASTSLVVHYPVAFTARWVTYPYGYFSSFRQAYTLVTIYPQNGSTSKKIMSDVNNGYITAPQAPLRIGYTFKGWYKDAACTTAWNFTTAKITGNISVYAKWSENAGTASFNSPAGSGLFGADSIPPANLWRRYAETSRIS